jgi:hypothetical protein
MSEALGYESPKRLFSLRTKLLIGFTLAFTIVFAASYYWFYAFATDEATGQIEEDLLATLEATAQGVDGDAFRTMYTDNLKDERCAVPEDPEEASGYYPEEPRFWEHIDWLATVQAIEPRARVYTYTWGERENEMVYVGSSGAIFDPPAGAPFCYRAIARTEWPYNGFEETTLVPGSYTDEFGKWVTGYAPIRNADGEVVGAAGVDFEASYVEEVRQGIVRNVLIAFALSYVVLFALVYLASGLFTRSIATLTESAERVGEGDYEQDFSDLTKGRFRDEISTLAYVFGIMVDKVYQRERALRERVRELEIMVDTSKRDEQVQEIVDSDFFQDLQDKARRMRDRSGDREEDSDSE